VAAWRAGSRDPAVAAFVQAAFEVARSAAGPGPQDGQDGQGGQGGTGRLR